MPSKSQKHNEEKEVTIKEASDELGISESTVKKYLKDFDLKVLKGHGSKAIISNEVYQILSEISKLRANGLSIQEIKELKSQEPASNIIDDIEKTTDENISEKQQEEKDNSINAQETESEKHIESDLSLDEEVKEEPVSSDEAASEETLPEEDKSPEPQEGQERVRRGFNYRYVERQISNDSKRVSSLRRRLQNPNLSIQEKLFFEDALERRILFLNGWKHILRWVSKQ